MLFNIEIKVFGKNIKIVNIIKQKIIEITHMLINVFLDCFPLAIDNPAIRNTKNIIINNEIKKGLVKLL